MPLGGRTSKFEGKPRFLRGIHLVSGEGERRRRSRSRSPPLRSLSRSRSRSRSLRSRSRSRSRRESRSLQNQKYIHKRSKHDERNAYNLPRARSGARFLVTIIAITISIILISELSISCWSRFDDRLHGSCCHPCRQRCTTSSTCHIFINTINKLS